MLANGDGVERAGFGMEVTIWKPYLGFVPVFFLDSPLFHVSASIDSGVVRSSISSPDYPNLFSRRCFYYYYYYWFLLEYIRESLSFSQLLMLSEIFLFGSMNIRAGLLSTTSLRQQTRERNNLAAVCL